MRMEYISRRKFLILKLKYKEMGENDFEIFEPRHSARWSNVHSSKILTDQIIEQTLLKSMKLMKLDGGAFRRRATQSVVFKWIKSTTVKTDVVDEKEKIGEVSLDHHISTLALVIENKWRF